MTEPDHAPPPPRLDDAADHRAAAELAAAREEYRDAVRERFRAMVRGVEQSGMLPEQRARTARQTAEELPQAPELRSAAQVFDEVVYGARPAGAGDYRELTDADRYSLAPPPRPDLVETAAAAGRPAPAVPRWASEPRLWLALAAVAGIIALLFVLPSSCGAPSPPPPKPSPSQHGDGSGGGSPDDRSVFQRLPAPVVFGGAQLAVAVLVLAWWRGRRRGAIVPEPLPVTAPANEVLHGRAELYRRARDYPYVAARLRAGVQRRLRRALGVADPSPEALIAAVAARIGQPDAVRAALTTPVPDAAALAETAARLNWIEKETTGR
jgi:uncharacterized membrane protein